MNLCDIKTIKQTMAMFSLNFRKEFGQNFLINRHIPEDIADSCSDKEDCMILEIGPGIGCLTAELAKRAKKVVSIELDERLLPVLDETLAVINSNEEYVVITSGDSIYKMD